MSGFGCWIGRSASLFALVSLSGCALFSSQVQVSRRYAGARSESVDCKANPADANCYVAMISALPQPAADTGFAATALSDRGQAAYIAALAPNKDPAALRAALAATIKSKPDSDAYADSTTLKLRFVIGLFPANGYVNPSDRLTWAKLTIEPISGGLNGRFVAWTQAANQDEIVEIGNVSATRTETLTAATGVGIGGPLSETTAGLSAGATRVETADIKDRVRIGAAIRDGSAVIVQTGGWRRDLTGNSTFDASVQVAPGVRNIEYFTSVGPLVPEKSATAATVTSSTASAPAAKWSPASEVSLTVRQRRLPAAQPLCARVTLDFVSRRTRNGHRTFTESDDWVTFVRGQTSSVQRIAPPMIVERWNIEDGEGRYLQFDGPSTAGHIVQFAGKEEALAFIAWLQEAKPAGKIANGTLFFQKDRDLSPSAFPRLNAVNASGQIDWTAANAPCVEAPGTL